MNELKTYTLEQANDWDKIVRSFKEYDIYWTSGYVKAFSIHGDGEPLLFYFDDGKTRGINVVMKRDVANDDNFRDKIPENQYFDFATPYGYGGWIIEGDNSARLFERYGQWISKNGIISEFVRFHPMVKNHSFSGEFFDITQLGEVVYIDLSSPEMIWGNFTSQNRNKIRKAIKNGVKIYNGRYPEIFSDFIKIYEETMNKDKAEDYYYFKEDFFESVLEDLPQNAQIFYAEKDHVVIAASIMLVANGWMNYHLSGSLREYSNLAPVNLLLYEAALWGNANGCKCLYLGGGVGSGEDSLFTFKRGFNKGEINRFYIGKKIYNFEKYEELLNIRGNIQSSYFPLYRAVNEKLR